MRQLEVFGAIMKTGSTIGAAHLLYISQPSVSNSLKRLEGYLGFDLFDRVSGRLQPTEEARVLYREVQDISVAFDKTNQVVDELRHDRRGHLRIAATPVLGNSIIPRAISKFVKDRSQVKVSLEIKNLEDVLDMTGRGEVDIGVAVNPHILPTLTSRRICAVRMVCVLRSDHPLAKHKQISPLDLENEHLISFNPDTVLGRLIASTFTKEGLLHQINVEIRYCETACQLAQTGAGIAIVDQFVLSGAHAYADLVVRDFIPSIEVGAYLLVPKFRKASRIATVYAKILRDELVSVEAELNPASPGL